MNNVAMSEIPEYADSDQFDSVKGMLDNEMVVIDDFVSESEEKSILAEIEPYIARLRYEYSHWDDVRLAH